MTENETNKDPNESSESEVIEAEIIAEGAEEIGVPEEGAIAQDDELLDENDLEISALEQELIEARAQADEYLDGWQRARAEFANYKKRVEREQSQTYQVASGSILKRYLDVLDDLERALKDRPQGGDGASWADGIELIYRKFLSILESEGVTLMETEGQLFDPNLHEAISSEDSDDHECGEIIDVLQQGYMLGDRVLRPATVRVAS